MIEFINNYWWVFIIILVVGELIRKNHIIKKNNTLLINEINQVSNLTYSNPLTFEVHYGMRGKCFQVVSIQQDKICLEELGVSFTSSSKYHSRKWYYSKSLPTALISKGMTFKIIETVTASGDGLGFQKGPVRKDW